MKVTYWGVRGSMPVPGRSTTRYGGNTSCVAVQRGDALLVIDAGTGIVSLGERLDPGVKEIFVLLTHRHMDHVQGLPFFEPLYSGTARVTLLDVPVRNGFWTPLELFDGVAVPMRRPEPGMTLRRAPGNPFEALRERGWDVSGIELCHPGGSRGIRIGDEGSSFVHLTDTELRERGDGGSDYFERCVAFCRRADVLSHDAQYLAGEMSERRGRGHSSVERVCDLAEAAGVGRLVLFHHDPQRDDATLARVEQWAGGRLAAAGIRCVAAREGMVLQV